MTLTVEVDLDMVKVNQHDRYVGQSYISFGNYCLDTQTHTHRTNCSTWTTN